MNILGLGANRINRLSYFLTILISAFAFVAIGLALSSILTAIFGAADPDMPDSPHPLGLIPLMVLWFVYLTLISARRFHDMNITGWLSLGILLPFVGLILNIMLLFIGGTDGENKYGRPHYGVQVMGLILGQSKTGK